MWFCYVFLQFVASFCFVSWFLLSFFYSCNHLWIIFLLSLSSTQKNFSMTLPHKGRGHGLSTFYSCETPLVGLQWVCCCCLLWKLIKTNFVKTAIHVIYWTIAARLLFLFLLDMAVFSVNQLCNCSLDFLSEVWKRLIFWVEVSILFFSQSGWFMLFWVCLWDFGLGFWTCALLTVEFPYELL